jgi:PPM family protein phosphatase
LATVAVHYAAAAITDRGRKRTSNEDAFGYSVEHGVYVVCDGMGGAAAGEIASSLAVDEVLCLLTARDGSRTLAADAEQAVVTANQAIHARAQRCKRLSGMGTTLVALLAEGSRAWMLNVGDSRGYRLRNAPDAHIEQITLDHSLVEEQVRMGRMTPLDAERSPLRNVITRALGTQKAITSDRFELETAPGDLFLLCSDGLTRELTDEQIEELLRLDLPLEERCERLAAAANHAGGHDNITCIVVRAEE